MIKVEATNVDGSTVFGELYNEVSGKGIVLKRDDHCYWGLKVTKGWSWKTIEPNVWDDKKYAVDRDGYVWTRDSADLWNRADDYDGDYLDLAPEIMVKEHGPMTWLIKETA